MAAIQILNLAPAGAELFSDRETFIDDLTNEELSVTGGGYQILAASLLLTAAGISYVVGRWGPRR